LNLDIALAKNIVDTRYETLPQEIIEATKKSILDTLGVMVAASTLEPACQDMVEIAKASGGTEDSTILVFGGKVPSPMAAFANGSLTHSLDYDDVHDEFGIHPTAACLPSALALSEQVGKVNGKRFITAITVANDLTIRLGSAITQTQAEHGWMRPTVFGTFGAAASAGKILELNESQMVTALSIAFTETAGTWESCDATGSNIRAIRDAFLGQIGVISALMANKPHIIGFSSSLEGRFGLYPIFFRGQYEHDRILTDLGQRYRGKEISFKPWPGCRYAHNPVTAILDMMQEYHIKPLDIEEIILNIDSSSVPLCSPIEDRSKPTTLMGARFSLPYIVAAAIFNRNLSLDDFTAEALNRPAVVNIAEKVSWRIDQEIEGTTSAIPKILVELRCRENKSYSKRATHPFGHPKNPIGVNDLKAKFRNCARYSKKPLTAEDIESVIDMVSNLEDLPDVTRIIKLLS
jgi:2-methylcitrate dehydratase PrpD